MPLEDENVSLAPEVVSRFAPENKPSFDARLANQLKAAWSLESDIGSMAANSPTPDYDLPYTDPDQARNFTVEDKLTDEERGYSNRFTDVFSDRDLAHVRGQIAREKSMKAALADGPLPEWLASMAGGSASLSMLIPIAGPLVKGGTALRTAGSLVTVGTSAAAGAAVQETILQSTQRTRTAEESAASVLGAFVLGGALGAVAGSLIGREGAATRKVFEESRPRMEIEIRETIRAAGLGDMPPPRTSLYDSTAVSRFLDADNSPNFKLPRTQANALAERDILNYIGDVSPKYVDNVSKAMRDVEVLQERIDRLSADPTLFSRAADIRDKPTLDMLATLDKEGTPAAKAKAAQIREGAQPAVVLNRLMDEMDEATARWQAAEDALARQVQKTRDSIAEVGAGLDPKAYAAMNNETANLYQQMKAALEEGKVAPQVKGDAIDWLRGFARYPGPATGKKEITLVKKLVLPDTKPSKLPEASGAKDLSAAAVGGDAPNYKPVYDNMNKLRNSFKAAEISSWLKKIGMASPSIELSMSRFETSRDVIQRIVYTGMTTEGHFKGVAAPDDLHTEVTRLGNPAMRQVQIIAEKAFDAYKLQVKAGLAPDLTRLKFYEAVGEAMTKGDQGTHAVITDAAKAFRKIDDHFKALATQEGVGVFKDGNPGLGKTASSHLYRSWHSEKIRANPQGFKILAQDFFKREYQLGDQAAADMADDVMHKILGSPEGRLVPEIKVSEGRGSAKERTFKIPDDFVTADGRYTTKDFVDRNVINVMSQYVRTMAGDIAYKKILDGDQGMEAIMRNLKDEADEMTKALGDTASPQAKKISDDLQRETQVIQQLVQRIRGVDPHPNDPRYAGLKSASKMMRDFNVVRAMGSSIISQLPDIARPVMVHGVTRIFGSMLGDLVDGFKMVKLGAKTAQDLGTANDMILAGRAGAIADMSELYTRQSKAEMVSGIVAHKALTLFGVSPWTVYMKARISYIGSNDMLRNIEKMGEGKEIPAKWNTLLASLGIDKDMAARIYAERPNWDEAARGYYVANTEKWKDAEAANKFSNALLRHIDNMIITPTAADRPGWMQGEVGKALTQFQSFGWATHQRILVSGLQQRDMDALNGVMVMIGLGMLGTALRDIVSKGEVDKTRDVRGWVREGVDRSGVLARVMETDALFGKAAGFSPIQAASGGQANRFASRGFVGQALGPTAGLVDDTAKALRGISDGSLTGADLHNIRRIIPLQNFILLRGALDAAEENLVTNYGLTPRQQ